MGTAGAVAFLVIVGIDPACPMSRRAIPRRLRAVVSRQIVVVQIHPSKPGPVTGATSA